MGGLDSGVTDATKNILLESAYFKPSTISGKARDLGLHTDASHRYERGVDPRGQERALERITGLLLDIAGGAAGPLIHAVSEAHVPPQNGLGRTFQGVYDAGCGLLSIQVHQDCTGNARN